MKYRTLNLIAGLSLVVLGLFFPEIGSAQEFAPAFVPPARQGVEAYNDLLQRSLFAVPTTPVEEAAPAGPGFAERFELMDAFSIGDRNLISVMDKTQGKTVELDSSQPPPDGWKFVKVDWGTDVQETRVHLEVGSEMGVLGFRKERIFGAASPASGEGGPQRPNIRPGQPPSAGSPMPPPPEMPEQIRRRIESGVPPMPPGQMPGATPNPGGTNEAAPVRRRIIRPPTGAVPPEAPTSIQ